MKKHTTGKKSPESIQSGIFHAQLMLIIPLTVFLAVAGLAISLIFQTRARNTNLINTAQLIAHHYDYSEHDDTELLMSHMDAVLETLRDIDVISIISSDGTRLYHSNHELIGTKYDGTLPDSVKLTTGYTESSVGPSGNQRRAYAPLEVNGETIGFVLAVMLDTNIRIQITWQVLIFVGVTFAAVILEMLLSHRLSKRVKDKLLGYEPDTFSSMFQTRENILESLSEGLVAVSVDQDVEYVNASAVSLLNFHSDTAAKLPEEEKSYAISLLSETLRTGTEKTGGRRTAPSGREILYDCVPIKEKGSTIGAIAILHDRTEYEKLVEDLAGTRFLVDSMRANNHDFTNKLHVILGLLQIGMYDQAMSYIENITIVQRESISRIMHAIDDSAVSALLIGKTARCSECNIKFVLQENSHYCTEDLSLPSQSLITIIGNLIENAVEAMNHKSSENVISSNELTVGIFSKPGHLLITVTDTGCGIAPNHLEQIFTYGFSTKGTGRGIGLAQTKQLVESLGGTISVESTEQAGTAFTITITK